MKVAIEQLRHHPINIEVYGEITVDRVKDIAASMAFEGLKEPLVVNNKFEVISGNRRLVAAKSLGWKEIEIIQMEFKPEEEATEVVSRNLKRTKTASMLLAEANYLYQRYSTGQGYRADLKGASQNPYYNQIKKNVRAFVAGVLGITDTYLGDLRFIQKTKPELLKEVDEGKKKVTALAAELRKRQQEQAEGLPNSYSHFQADESFVRIAHHGGKNSTSGYSDKIVSGFLKRYDSAKAKSEDFFLEELLSATMEEFEKRVDEAVVRDESWSYGLFERIQSAVKSGQFAPVRVVPTKSATATQFTEEELSMDNFMKENSLKFVGAINREKLNELRNATIAYIVQKMSKGNRSRAFDESFIVVRPTKFKLDLTELVKTHGDDWGELLERLSNCYTLLQTLRSGKTELNEQKKTKKSLLNEYAKIRVLERRRLGFFGKSRTER